MTQVNNLLGDFVTENEVDESSQLEMLGSMMTQQLNLEDHILKIEEQLKEAKRNYKALSEVRLPDFIERYGLEGIEFEGKKLTIKNIVAASITEENLEEALKWLTDNGFGDLIKSELKLSFGRGEEDEASACREALKELGLVPGEKQGVHHSTLKAFVKKQIEVQQDFPKKLFSVYESKKAIIK